MAEFAIASTLAILLMLVTLQVALIVIQAYSATHVARRTARWLAVRIDATDAQVVAQAAVEASGFPGMSDGGLATVTIGPTTPDDMRCPTLVSGKCPNRDSGDAVTVTVTTNIGRVMFLPTSFGRAPFRVEFPTTMQSIAYTVVFE